MRITPEYKALQQQLHANGNYGVSGAKHADKIMGLCQKLGTKDVLDYGCGKQTLQKNLPFPINQYDPCIPGLDAEPEPADLVVCTDVMEHIELGCLNDVIQHLHQLCKKVVFLDIAQRPAQKYLADGRNAHLIQMPTLWWIQKLDPYFDLHSLQTYGGGFVMVATPRVIEERQA